MFHSGVLVLGAAGVQRRMQRVWQVRCVRQRARNTERKAVRRRDLACEGDGSRDKSESSRVRIVRREQTSAVAQGVQ